jgi:hypothetical protein
MNYIYLLAALFLLSGCAQKEISLTEEVQLQLTETSKIELYRTPKEVRISQCISSDQRIMEIINAIDLVHEVPVSDENFRCHFLFQSAEQSQHLSFDHHAIRLNGKQYKLTEKSQAYLYEYFRSLLENNEAGQTAKTIEVDESYSSKAYNEVSVKKDNAPKESKIEGFNK